LIEFILTISKIVFVQLGSKYID